MLPGSPILRKRQWLPNGGGQIGTMAREIEASGFGQIVSLSVAIGGRASRNVAVATLIGGTIGCGPRVTTTNATVIATARDGASLSSGGEVTRQQEMPRPTVAQAHTSTPSELGRAASDEGELEQGEPPRGSNSPLVDSTWTELKVPGFEPAVLFYRVNAPVFVVTHGAGGDARWHCQHFHRFLRGQATLLCPRGKLRYAGDPSQGYYYPDHFALRREVIAAVEQFEALVQSERAVPGGVARPYTYAGYSQGATMGALAFGGEGQLFSHLLLVEGGFADWSKGLIAAFKRSDGHAVLFVCGTEQCQSHARVAVQGFLHAGLRAKLVMARGAGHRPDGAVGKATGANLGFLLEGDPRWEGFVAGEE